MYQPFLVANYRHGRDEGIQPWLLPQDAFSALHNGHLKRGVLEKRQGYSLWHQFVYAVDDESIGSSGSTLYSGTLSNIPIRAGDLSFTDGTQTMTDDGDGGFTGDGTGTINYTTGVYSITFNSTTTGAVTADYDYYPGNSIIGMESYYKSTGAEEFLVWDTKRCCSYDDVNDKLEDVTGADTWTSGDTQFMWAENWKNLIFVVNNVDRLKYYNGTTFANLDVDIDDDATNELDTCLLIFAYKERLVLLRTTEDGSAYPQRARWPAAGSYTDWVDSENGGTGGYVDAPTLDWIVSADFIGDDLVVFFERSVWKLRYTGNATLPFRWEKVPSTDGSYAPFATAAFANELVTVGGTSIIGTDGLETYDIDDKVPDLALQVDQAKADAVYSAVIEEQRQVVMLYPSIGATSSDSCIVMNYEDKSFSTYDYPFNVIGYYKEISDYTLDDIDESFDEIEYTFDEKSKQSGYPAAIGGDINGNLYKLYDSSSDLAAAIDFYAVTGRLNPFLKEGKKARLGFVDFLVDVNLGVSVYIDFYIDQNIDPYLTKEFSCGEATETESGGTTFPFVFPATFGATGGSIIVGSAEQEKVWKRVYVNTVGAFHKLKIYNDQAAQTPKIHAMAYWFQKAGKII